MFSYLAFKGMRILGDVLQSPIVPHAVWREEDTPYGRFPACEAGQGDLERGLGVFAADYPEARGYSHEVFLVAPDPTRRVVLGASGWRAEKAFIVRYVGSNISGAYEEILRAFLSGYPQVPEVLASAIANAENGMLVIAACHSLSQEIINQIASAYDDDDDIKKDTRRLVYSIFAAVHEYGTKDDCVNILRMFAQCDTIPVRVAAVSLLVERFPAMLDAYVEFVDDPVESVRRAVYSTLLTDSTPASVHIFEAGLKKETGLERAYAVAGYILSTKDYSVLSSCDFATQETVMMLLARSGGHSDVLSDILRYATASPQTINTLAGVVSAFDDYVVMHCLSEDVISEVFEAIVSNMHCLSVHGNLVVRKVLVVLLYLRQISSNLLNALANMQNEECRRLALRYLLNSLWLDDSSKLAVTTAFLNDPSPKIREIAFSENSWYGEDEE